jgi:predicted transcriptional regulator of viral defense system
LEEGLPVSLLSKELGASKDVIHRWVKAYQERGRYVFTRKEAVAALPLNAAALTKALQRLGGSGRIQPVRRGFYAIVPLEYRKTGGIPADWFIDDLMHFLNLPYYAGVLTAAALHGSSHHQPQAFQVVVPSYVPAISTGKGKIEFFKLLGTEAVPAQNLKTYTGYLRVSTPAWTALDLLRFNRRIGGLDAVFTVLSELAEKMTAKGILEACKLYRDRSLSQRLGWLLDRLERADLTAPLAKWLQKEGLSKVRLDPSSPYRGGSMDRKWHVLVNAEPESEI